MNSKLEQQLRALPKYNAVEIAKIGKQYGLKPTTTIEYFYKSRRKAKAHSNVKPKLTRSINLTTNAEIVIEGVKIMIPGNSISINGTKIEW